MATAGCTSAPPWLGTTRGKLMIAKLAAPLLVVMALAPVNRTEAAPAGVYFGQGAYVSVGGLFAAAGNISNEDFLKGMNHFTGLSGDVLNAGSINASSVALVGWYVANVGAINVFGGLVMLLVGNEVL